MTETSGNGVTFNEQVMATRFAGTVVERLDRLEGDGKEVKADVKLLVGFANEFKGAVSVAKVVMGLATTLGAIGTFLGALAALGAFK